MSPARSSRRLTSLCITLLLWLLASPVKSETFVVVADAWDGYTHKDGTGLWFDMWRQILGPLGHTVQPRIVPYPRALEEITKGKSDITPAVYQGDLDDKHVELSIIIEQDSVDAFIIDEHFPDWQGLASLKGKTVVARLDYGYGRFLPTGAHYSEKASLQGMLHMLALGRVDAVLDYEREVTALVQETGMKPVWTLRRGVLAPSQHAAFADTPKGRWARDLFVKRMRELLANDGLVPLLKHHEVERHFYPKLNPGKP